VPNDNSVSLTAGRMIPRYTKPKTAQEPDVKNY